MCTSEQTYPQSICFFPTPNLERTRAFYQDTLGLQLTLDQGACHIYRASPTGFIGFCTHREQDPAEGVIITLVDPEVETTCERLRKLGVTIERGPGFNRDFQITQAFLRDPSGYLVEIQRFEDPRWPAAP